MFEIPRPPTEEVTFAQSPEEHRSVQEDVLRSYRDLVEALRLANAQPKLPYASIFLDDRQRREARIYAHTGPRDSAATLTLSAPEANYFEVQFVFFDNPSEEPATLFQVGHTTEEISEIFEDRQLAEQVAEDIEHASLLVMLLAEAAMDEKKNPVTADKVINYYSHAEV